MNTSFEKTNKETPAWVVVAGGAHKSAGTDKANYALVEYLLTRGVPVHMVTHHIDADLARHPLIRVESVPVPGGSWFAGERLLSFQGQRAARRITARDPRTRVLVNGGNCIWGDINWVHYVHHAWSVANVQAPWSDRLKHRVALTSAKWREKRSLRAARLLVTNSDLTRRHVTELLEIDPHRIHTVHLGAETDWVPASAGERSAARRCLRLSDSRPVIVFFGAIAYDHRKGLDVLLEAWQRLCRQPDWNADLVVAGEGRALPGWRALVAKSDCRDRVRFLGFTENVPELLAAADLVVSPVRYESFGLNVQEALCRGIPTIVSAGAGVAERYSPALSDLLLPDPEDVEDLVNRMLMWKANPDYWREQTARLSNKLRQYSWSDMARQIYELAKEISPLDYECTVANSA